MDQLQIQIRTHDYLMKTRFRLGLIVAITLLGIANLNLSAPRWPERPRILVPTVSPFENTK
jgi:hypothetical protein